MNDEKLEEGISLGELFSIIWKNKIIISIITFCTSIVLVLIVTLFVNPNLGRYTAQFDLSFPGIEENKLPSGYTFDYRDIISDENINKVIEKSEGKFDYIKVNSFKNDTINISSNTPNNKDQVTITKNYTISCDGSLFKSRSDASLFIDTLVSLVKEDIIEDVTDYSYYTYLNSANTSNEVYEVQLNFLEQQVQFLSRGYNELFEEYGTMLVNERTILDYMVDFNTFFSINSVSTLINELHENNYVKTNTDYHNSRKASVSYEITVLNEKISQLMDYQPGSSDGYTELLASMLIKRADLIIEEAQLQSKINNSTPGTPGFNAKVDNLSNEIKKYTDTYKEVVITLNDNLTTIRYENREVVTSSGTISIILASVGSLVLVGGVTSVVFIGIDLTKKNNKKTEENSL